MNIGINAAFQARGGSLTNFLQLIRNWEDLRGEHSITLFTNSYTLNALKSEIPSTWKVISIRPNLPTLPGRVLSEQLILPYLIFREKIDVLYCPANITPLLVHQPCVVTFQNFGPFSERSTISALGLGTWLRFQTLKFFMLASAKKAQLVLFGSSTRTGFQPLKEGLFIGHQRNLHRTALLRPCSISIVYGSPICFAYLSLSDIRTLSSLSLLISGSWSSWQKFPLW